MRQVLELLSNFSALEQCSEHIAVSQYILAAQLLKINVKTAIFDILLANLNALFPIFLQLGNIGLDELYLFLETGGEFPFDGCLRVFLVNNRFDFIVLFGQN